MIQRSTSRRQMTEAVCYDMSTQDGDRPDSPESSMISKPHHALLEPQSYSPQILTIGPLHKMLDGSRSFDHYKVINPIWLLGYYQKP